MPKRADSLSRDLPVALFQLSGIPETVSADLLSPLILKCRTRQGDVYDGSVAAGEFGFELYEQNKEKGHPDSMSTITIEAYVPGRIKLTPTFLARRDAAELKMDRATSMTSSPGAVMSSILPVPLNDVGTVAVSLKIRNVNE